MTETDSMVVRVAKAIRDTNADTTGLTFTELSHAMARAAIEAMKEPTPAVLDEGYNKMDFDDGVDDNAEEFNRRVVQRVWSAMIGKALEE